MTDVNADLHQRDMESNGKSVTKNGEQVNYEPGVCHDVVRL